MVTVIGANAGLGLEAACHFVCLGAKTVTPACRNLSKSNAAKEDLDHNTRRKDVTQVWEFNVSSHQSIQDFAEDTRSRAANKLHRFQRI